MDMLEHDGAEAQVEISLSIEETNKLRAQLGLKPLNLEKSQHEKKAEANYQALMHQSKKQKEAIALKQRIEKSKIRQKLREKLKGHTLAQPDLTIDDTLSWIQRQKEKAKVFEAQLEETDRQSIPALSSLSSSSSSSNNTNSSLIPTSSNYDARDLQGLKVAHGINRFEEGKEFILTLKDKKILSQTKKKSNNETSILKNNSTNEEEEEDEEKDELENIDLLTKEKLELKAKAMRGYNAFDEDEEEEEQETILTLGNTKSTRPLLKKYDEPSVGKEGFILSNSSSSSSSSSSNIHSSLDPTSSKPSSISLDFEKMNPIQDFYTAEDMPLLQKPKKRKRPLSMRKKNDSSSLPSDPTPLESNLHTDVSTMNFVDDDDLQQTLLLARSKRSSKRSLPSSSSSSSVHSFFQPTTLVDTSMLEISDPSKEDMDHVGLIFDATTEFAHSITLANLAQVESGSDEEGGRNEKEKGNDDDAEEDEDKKMSVKVKKQAKKYLNTSNSTLDTSTFSDPKELLSSTKEDGKEMLEVSNSVVLSKKRKSELETSLNQKRRKVTSQNENDEKSFDSEEEVENEWKDMVEEEEEEYYDYNDKEEPAHPLQDEPDLNLGVGAALELFRKRGHLASADPEKLAREKEYMERLKWGLAHPTSKDKSKSAMKARIKDQVSKFKDYKPSINLDYVDEHGRALSTKEAYRQLSHRFHGRSSGKNKQEKLMRKEEERRRMLHMAGSDTPLQLASAMLEKQIALGTPGILLSVGNRPAPHESSNKK